MKFKNLENTLAVLAAVVILVGVSFAAENALAKETADLDIAHDDTSYALTAGQ